MIPVMGDHAGHRHLEPPGRAGSRLAIALALVSSYLVAEVAAGLWTGSLALLADAGHMLADAGSLALSLFALWLVERPAPLAHTFGYRRAEILAALANGAALAVVAVLITVEAFERLAAPPPVLGGPMLAVAAGGLAVNLVGLALLHRDRDLNLRGAWLHLLSDALGSVGAMAAGAALVLFDWRAADPLASLAIGALVLRSAWGLVRETVDVLLEAAPAHVDVAELRRSLQAEAGVVSVHDLHVWTIASGMVSLSCHVHAAAEVDDHHLLGRLRHLLRERYAIQHVTIQLEPEGFKEREEVC
jgi:cobalt-zinc-cadmium efflux system protein